MDLKKIIDNRDKYGQYMIDEITHIIKTFDKRDPGSKGEKDACVYMADQLKELGCYKADLEYFKENPGSFFGWIYFTITFVMIAIVLFFLKMFGVINSPVVNVISAVLIFGGLFIGFLQFGMYKKVVDRFFEEKTGTNVTAFKAPTGEVKRRIIFNGHPDACWEWPVNYALGGVFFEMHAVIAAVGAVYYAVLSIMAIDGLTETIRKMGLIGLIFVPFLIGLCFMWNQHRVVDGANDNLSGCYMGIAILKALKDEGIELENTEIGVVISGSEEAGLRGSKAWSELHAHDFDDVPTFIYSYDTIHDPKYLLVNYRDLNASVKADKDVSDLFYESAQELNVTCNKGMVPPLGGATDNAAFAQAGLRSTGITGLNHKLENYYHTRRDTYDNMNLRGLADCFAVSVKVLENFDKGAKQ